MNCEDIRMCFADYLEGSLSDEEKANITEHLETCTECRQELSEMKKLLEELEENKASINIPEEFMDNVKSKVNKTLEIKPKKNKSPFKVVLVAAAILAMSVVTVVAAKDPIMELIRLISPESRINNILDKGVGDRLNISKTDKDIKITVTNVVADDIQTLISYKIEDLKSSKEYRASFKDGIDIRERWGREAELATVKMYTSIINTQGKGTLSLFPIDTEKKTINLAFNKLETGTGADSEIVEGNWDFEIPITKHEGKSYDIKAAIKVDHYTIEFNKITISPTLTTLNFNLRNGSREDEDVIGLEDVRLFVKGKEYKPYNFGHGNWDAYSTLGSGNSQMTFDTMYFDNPKEIEIRVTRIDTKVVEAAPKEFTVKLDETKPQEFEYLGTKLYLSNMKVGDNITFDLKQPEYNSNHEILSLYFWPAEEHSAQKSFSSIGKYNEAYFVDTDNNKYEYFDALSMWDKIRTKNPVMYIANASYKLEPSKGFDIKKEKTIRMIIDGYHKTRFVNESVKIKLQ